jgi:membrane protein implicated in regulation of membrane protease activity
LIIQSKTGIIALIIKDNFKKSCMKNKVLNIVGWLIAVAVLVVIIWAIARGGDGDKKRRMNEESSMADEVAGVRAQEMEAFTEGEFTYRFEGIQWFIEADDEPGVSVPVTRLSWMLDNFSRRDNGVMVTFGNPYKLSAIQGMCSEVMNLEYDPALEEGIPLSFVECQSTQGDETVTSEYIVLQEGKNVVVKSRSGVDLAQDTPFVLLTSKDLTQIVE